ncbi:MAG: nuclear transport factor 2 family protein [Aeromicrobium sp.]
MSVITELDQLNVAFAEHFNARDLDGLHGLFAADAIFVPAPGTPVPTEAVRGALEQFLGLNLPISMNVRHAFATGDLGLVVADWTIEGTGPDGSPVSLAGTTSDVARRDEGGWKFVIDNPFGTA